MIPQILADDRDTILGADCDPRSQSIPYYAATWRRFFADDADFEAVVAAFPEQMTRTMLCTLSQRAATDPALLRQLFLATMLWGFGTVGYGAYRTTKMTSEPSFAQQIVETASLLRAGQIADAYLRLRLPSCGPAFITKFLYTVGLGGKIQPMPLVLDSLVVKALNKLRTHGAFDLTTRQLYTSQGYLHYLTTVDQWGHALGCSPERIEVYLFRRGSQIHTDARPPKG